MNLSHVSTYGMQMFLLFAVGEDPQISWEKAVMCIIYICLLLYRDSDTEWQFRNTVTTPICIVPASRLFRQGCWYHDPGKGKDHSVKSSIDDQTFLQWVQENYDHDIKIMALVVFFLNLLFVWIHLYNSKKRIKKVLKKHGFVLTTQETSCAQETSCESYTLNCMFVIWNANLYLYLIIIAWSFFETLSLTLQITFFQMMTAKKNLLFQFFSGEFFQNEMEITCSWSNAGGASTAGTVSNSSWFSWS
jgi:hypothetical protein